MQEGKSYLRVHHWPQVLTIGRRSRAEEEAEEEEVEGGGERGTERGRERGRGRGQYKTIHNARTNPIPK